MLHNVFIDIGGTTFSFVVFLDEQLIYKSECYDIKKYKDYHNFVKDLTSLITKQTNAIKMIGIACPGPLNYKTGEILNTPNLPIMRYMNLKHEIKKYIDCDNIYIENDANIYAMGSYYILKNKKDSDVLLGITLGTGIGFGIIINGKLFRGGYGMAGEYELSPLDKNLTWGDLIGYKFFEKTTQKIFKKKITPKELYMLAETKNKNALDIWVEYGTNIGMCLSHVICIINPNHISIGGGISNANKYFHNSIIKVLENKCLIYDNELIKITYDDADIGNIFCGWF
jgi:glucokinase